MSCKTHRNYLHVDWGEQHFSEITKRRFRSRERNDDESDMGLNCVAGNEWIGWRQTSAQVCGLGMAGEKQKMSMWVD